MLKELAIDQRALAQRLAGAANAAIDESTSAVKEMQAAVRRRRQVSAPPAAVDSAVLIPMPIAIRRPARPREAPPTEQARAIARRCSTASTSTTRCSANARARRGATSRPATGSRSSTSPATASISTTAACSETAERIEREFRTAGLDGAGRDALWEQVKLHFIGLLIDHKQPECAETFFNSVSVKLLHRDVLPQPLHLRAPGDLDRVHRRRPAVVPQLLPAAAGACATR